MNTALIFLHRLRWIHLPGAVLLALLQRTPVLRVAATAETVFTASPLGAVLRAAFTGVASLGAVHALAGATQFVYNPRNPPFTGTVGTTFPTVVFTVTGAQTPPGSFRITNVPPGLSISGLGTNGILNASSAVLSGAPTTAGTFTMNVLAYEFNNALGDVWPTNSQGQPQAAAITFTIAGGAIVAPTFTLQPVGANLSTGGSVTLTSTATGSPTPTYQWRKNGTNVLGATASVFAISNAQVSDSGDYTVVASNSGGNVTSNAATVQVTAPNVAPVFTTQPAGQSVLLGSSVTLTAAASGTPAPTYQWRKDGANVSGATAGTLSLPSAQLSDSGTYVVVATNSVGSVTSNAAILTVASATVAPAFTLQPAGQTVNVGANVTFTVAASGSPTPTLQWRKNGAAIPGATANTFTLASVQATDAGDYSAVATNSAGSATSNTATLQVTVANAAPVFSVQPADQSVLVGATATFTATATGSPAPTYQWRKNGTAVPGATAASLTIPNVQVADAGDFSVVATNSVGTSTSNTATLRVTAAAVAPVFTLQPAGQTVAAGSTVTFTSIASGSPTPSYQWRKNGTAITGATTANFSLASAQATDAGDYTVVATNSAGTVTSNTATLQITVVAGVTARLSNLSVRTAMAAGQTLIVGVVVDGGPRNVLVRAAGPALAAFGLATAMADPRLDLFNGAELALSNDNWDAALAPTFATVGAFAFPAGSRDAGFIQSVDGARSIQARGTGAGVVLVEAYDLGAGNSPRMVNVSARNRVGTGDDILIAGFNLAGTGPTQLLIRAVGPKLGAFGVTGFLANPKLEVYSGAGVKLTENDDWGAALATTFNAVGAFPLDIGSRDAALLTSLEPGTYTVQVSGVGGGTGEALIEIYEVK